MRVENQRRTVTLRVKTKEEQEKVGAGEVADYEIL